MTDPTTDELATQLAALRRKMVAAATDETTPEQRAQWKTADEDMARRIHKARPRVPQQHALATLETLRAIQRYEASATDVPAEPMPDEQADALLSPLEAKARALHAQKDAEHRAAVLREAFAAISADAALRETEGEYGLAEYGRELARLVEGLADGAPVSGEGTTADKAYALGLTDTEYRARSHAAAVAAVRAAIPGMYAHVGLRLEDVLNEAGETQSFLRFTDDQDGCYIPTATTKRPPMDPVHILGIGSDEDCSALRAALLARQQPPAETQQATPCSQPNACGEDGEPCDAHERQQAHAEGEHRLCGPECTAVSQPGKGA